MSIFISIFTIRIDDLEASEKISQLFKFISSVIMINTRHVA